MKYAGFAAIAGALILVGCYPNYSWTGALAIGLAVALLAFVGSRCAGTDAELIIALTGFYFVPASLINLTEAALFDVVKISMVPTSLLRDLFFALTAAAAIAFALRGSRPQIAAGVAPSRGPLSTGLRVGGAILFFAFFYFAAGAIIFPFVKQYYSVRTMPPMQAIASMQVFRALAMMLAAYPVLRMISSARDARIALAIGIPLIGAIVPLLPPNDLMPGNVRLVHGLEVVAYYSAFGYLVARWFGPQAASRHEAAQSHAPVTA